MKAAILGYGIEGKVSAEYWLSKGCEVTICDKDEAREIPDKFAKRVGPNHLKDLEGFDVLVRTSGLHPRIIAENNPGHPEVMDKVTTSLNEFLDVCPTKNIIGITGTKGKGTTSTLVHLIIRESNLPVHLGGNIGIAPLSMLEKIKGGDWVVLELSSFQLIDLKHRISNAVCLMLAPEHLDWHADMDEYVDAKANLFKLQTPADRAIFNRRSELSKYIAGQSPASKVSYEVPPPSEGLLEKTGCYVLNGKIHYDSEEVCSVSEVAMIGRHNLENVCAAIAAAWPVVDGNKAAISRAVNGFSGLAHHMEYVAEVDGVKYYNDSYSTMPDATIAALAAVPEPKVLIVGGRSKNLPLDGMIKAIKSSNVKHVVLNGSMAGEVERLLKEAGYNDFSRSTNDMPGFISEARKYAKPGDVVLLSPGLPAKYDGYFIDNVDRGNQFKQEVKRLAGKQAIG